MMVWLSVVIHLILIYLQSVEFMLKKGLFLFMNKKGGQNY